MGEELKELPQDEIRRASEGCKKDHRNEDHDRGVRQLLISGEAFFFWIPWPVGFLKLNKDL